MKAWSVDWPPCNVFAVGIGALAAIEVDTKLFAGGGRIRSDGEPGDAHEAVPDFLRRIDPCGDFTAGLPDPADFVRRVVEIDIEVDPLALRRDLKLLVAADVLEVSADEDFGNIPVP